MQRNSSPATKPRPSALQRFVERATKDSTKWGDAEDTPKGYRSKTRQLSRLHWTPTPPQSSRGEKPTKEVPLMVGRPDSGRPAGAHLEVWTRFPYDSRLSA